MIITVFQLRDFSQYVFQILIGFAVVRFCRFDETVQDGTGTSTIVSIAKEPVFLPTVNGRTERSARLLSTLETVAGYYFRYYSRQALLRHFMERYETVTH